MNKRKKQISSPSSTGGLGTHFENRVQTSFVVLMLTHSFAPCLPLWPINKIKLQGKYLGFDTDDLIIYVKSADGGKEAKLIGQIKHSIKITNNKIFNEIIQAAWNDFNNKELFDEKTDIIALICGPLSATDTNNVRAMIRQAEHSEDETDFITKINRAIFTSDIQRNKLEVFKTSLKAANNNDISDKQLWRFLKRFRLLIYDIDMKGVTLSLLHSLIGQYSQTDANSFWTQLNDITEWNNENAGTITLESIPENIRSVFNKPKVEVIPEELTKSAIQPDEVDFKHTLYASDLAIVNLIGSWNEKYDADKNIISQIANGNYSSWISKMREIIQQPKSPLSLKNGIWTVTERQKLWELFGSRIYDEHLDKFKKYAIEVLTERDPSFELKPRERYASSIYGKMLIHSHVIREAIAESLALIGCCSNVLTNCSSDKPETTAVLVLRKIFENADWVLWASLNNLLPLLAESAPETFLDAVEAALKQEQCPFDKLFSQEGNGITGENYLTGLLWALEGLAWDGKYLTRVSVVLAELSSRDPGGTWANRPANSLTTIFLPWSPKTTANIEKRKVAIKTIQKEVPEEGWNLLLSLFPRHHQASFGSHKPRWRKIIPEDWNESFSKKDYWEQVSSYAIMAVEMAKNNIFKLNKLISYLDHLTFQAFEEILQYLSSTDIIEKPEVNRFKIWEKLVNIASKHRKYADSDWAMSDDLVSKIEKVAEMLKPINPLYLYHRLFINKNFDLYEQKGSWQEQQKQLEEKRQQAIKEILDYGGIEAIFEFVKTLDDSINVGNSLGYIAGSEIDSIILPNLLEKDSKPYSRLIIGFIWGRYWSQGWGWVDKMNIINWTRPQIGKFLSYLPFTTETWNRAENLLKEFEYEYWNRAGVNPYQSKDDLFSAIDKLLKYNRPHSAIFCLNKILHDKQPLDVQRTSKALLAAVTTKETLYSAETHDILELIIALQEAPNIDSDTLFRIEWAYLPLLDRPEGASPKLLEKRLASDHSFYCEIIRLIYLSKNKDKSYEKTSENQKAIARNAYHLLHEWQMPPGLQPDGSFSENHFKKWLISVKKECSKSGHLDVALSTFGQVLIYTPPDPDGLWINKNVAEALNSKDAEPMRNGYYSGIYNSRGVHWVDPSGKPELEFFDRYLKQAEDVENAGFHRFAATLRELADSYSRQASRIREEHNNESSI